RQMADNQNIGPQQIQNTDNPAVNQDGANDPQSSPVSLQEIDLEYEIQELKKKVDESTMPQNLKNKLNGMILRLVKISQKGNFSQEFEPVSEYINWVVQIPFGKYTEDNIDINHAREELTKNHYGLRSEERRVGKE